jgi:fumarylpyruvate hydrolase
MKTEVDEMTDYVFTPPAVQVLPIRGKSELFPINRLFFVGRNYHAHAQEMGKPVDKSVAAGCP